MTDDQIPMTNDATSLVPCQLSFVRIRRGQIDVQRRLAVEIADDFAGLDVKSAVQLIRRRIGIELLNADLVLAGRNVAKFELTGRLIAFGNPRRKRFIGIDVGLKRYLNISVLT